VHLHGNLLLVARPFHCVNIGAADTDDTNHSHIENRAPDGAPMSPLLMEHLRWQQSYTKFRASDRTEMGAGTAGGGHFRSWSHPEALTAVKGVRLLG
jgi:hypothetical protein